MDVNPAIELYGGPILRSGAQQTAFAPTQACLIALAYLEPKGSLTRERVSWLLWEEAAKERQCHRIRQLVYAINGRASRRVLVREGEAILPVLPSDVAEMQPSAEPPLARVTAIPTAAFEQWQDLAVKRMEQERTLRLAKVLDDLLADGQWVRAFEIAVLLIEVSEGSLHWVEAAVSSAARAGKVQTARAILDDLEANSETSRERLKGLLARLDETDLLTSGQGPTPTLVGRKPELELLAREICEGHGVRFATVLGEAGIGKTRLLTEAGLSAAAAGVRVCSISLSRQTAAEPLGALRELLWQLSPAEEALGEPWRSVLRSTMKGTRSTVEVLDPLSNLHRLTEAFGLVIESASTAAPLAVLLDNLRWIDPSSLRSLAALSHRSTGARCTLVMALRTDQEHRPGFRTGALLQEVRSTRFVLRPLDRLEAEELVLGAGLDLEPAVREEVIEVASGNPYILLDLARAWAEGRQQDDIPQSIRDLVASRMSSLRAIDRDTLATVAVLPGQSSELIAGALGRPDWLVIDVLDRLVRHRLIELKEGGYHFPHGLVHDAVSASLGPIQVREAHLRVGRALEDSSESSSASIAHHLNAGGAHVRAQKWALQAAAQATECGALHEALRLYEVALEAPMTAMDDAVLAAAGKISLQLCHYANGIEYLRQAEERSAAEHEGTWAILRINAESEVGLIGHREAASALLDVASKAHTAGRTDTGLEALEGAIRVLERLGDWRTIKQIIASAESYSGLGLDSAIRLDLILALGVLYDVVPGSLEAAERAFRACRGPRSLSALEAKAAHRLFVVLLSLGKVNSEIGNECERVLVGRTESTGDLKLKYTTLANRAVWQLDTGDLDVARETLREAGSVVLGTGATHEQQNLATNWGDLLLREGSPSEALEQFKQAQALIEPGTRSFLRDVVRAGIGLCEARLGRLSAAERASAALREYEHYYFDPSLLIRLRVELTWRRGRRGEAIELLSDERSRIEQQFVPQYLSLGLLEARLRRRASDPAAIRLAGQIREQAQNLGISSLASQASALASYPGD